MDELTMVRDLGRETPEPDAGRLAAGRAALMAEAGRGPRRRRVAYGLAVAGLAAAVTGVLVLPDSQAPPPSPEQEMLPASQVLELAATAALAGPDVQPRPEQFLYRGAVGPDGKLTYEMWKSVDGTREGEVISYEGGVTSRTPLDGCADGDENAVPEQGGGCVPDPAYLPKLPSDVAQMQAYLRERNTQESADVRTNSTAKDIWYLASNHYLRPAQRAALYRAAAEVPGLKVVDGATDAAGRKGTGIAWTYAGGPEMMWIFDPKTHTFLGTPTETSTFAIVDKVGERS
jgi:hypothetical protein